MAVSRPVFAFYAAHLFPRQGRERAPECFRPLKGPVHGRSSVEGCRGGGKNVLEVSVEVEHPGSPRGLLLDARASCGLCNPAMEVAACLVVGWAPGRALHEVASLDPLDLEALEPFFQRLGTDERPEDAREKLQYALVALVNAARAAAGLAPRPPAEIAPPGEPGPEA